MFDSAQPFFLFGAGINLNKDTVVNNYTHVLPKLKQTFGNHSGVFYFSCDQGANFLIGQSPGNRHKVNAADTFRRRSCGGNMNAGVFSECRVLRVRSGITTSVEFIYLFCLKTLKEN